MISVSEPTIEVGENRYLHHYIYEVLMSQGVIGHIFLTRYNFRRAAEDQVLSKWLCQRDSYTEHNADLMLEPTSESANLPTYLAELIQVETGIMMLLDEVTFNPGFRGKNLESDAIRKMCGELQDMCDLIVIPDFAPMARYIDGISTSPIVYWESIGFSWHDTGRIQFMARTRDDNQKPIKTPAVITPLI